jgi:hypothetical protein
MSSHPVTTTALGRPQPAPGRPALLTGAAIGVAFVGPLAIGLARGILPYDTVDDPGTIVEKIMAAPGAQTAALGLAYLALLTLPLGVAMTGWLAIRVRPVFGTVAAVLAWLGFLSLFSGGGTDATALAATDAGVPARTVVQLAAAADAIPVLAVPGFVFVIGHILGVILLAVALRRVMPTWAVIALAVSQPLHLVFAVFVPNHALDALAWALTGVGFAAAAAVLVRRSRPVVSA